jgi:hypothetical protein
LLQGAEFAVVAENLTSCNLLFPYQTEVQIYATIRQPTVTTVLVILPLQCAQILQTQLQLSRQQAGAWTKGKLCEHTPQQVNNQQTNSQLAESQQLAVVTATGAHLGAPTRLNGPWCPGGAARFSFKTK